MKELNPEWVVGGEFVLNAAEGQLWRAGSEGVSLASTEWRPLEGSRSHPEAILSHSLLMRTGWNTDYVDGIGTHSPPTRRYVTSNAFTALCSCIRLAKAKASFISYR